MKETLYSMDILSPKHKITFRNQERVNTLLGLVMSFLLGIFCVVVFFFLSRDLFNRETPVSRSISEQLEESIIPLKDFPIPLTFTIGSVIADKSILEDFDIEASIMQINLNSPSIATKFNLKLEECKDEFFENLPQFKEIDYIKLSFCVNPFEMFDLNGNLVEGAPFISKEKTDDQSSSLSFEIRKKSHLTNEMFDLKYSKLSVTATTALKYVNVEDFDDPIKFRPYGIANIIDQNLVKAININAAKQVLKTDSDLVFNTFSSEEFCTFAQTSAEYYFPRTGGAISKISVYSSNFGDVQSREYVKLQTVLAQISGIIKLTYHLCQWIVSLFAQHYFYKENIERAVVMTRHIAKSNVDCSAEQINRTGRVSNELFSRSKSVSFWSFVFTRKKKFDFNFFPTSVLNNLFDVEKINRKLFNLENEADNFTKSRGVRVVNVQR